MRESEDWDHEKFRVYQFDRLKHLLIHAGTNVPYYRELFSVGGFHPEKIQDFDDIRKIPPLLRQTVRDSGSELIDERVKRATLMTMPTSGSSGIPLVVYKDKATEAAFLAFRANILKRAGYAPGSREVMFWPMVMPGGRRNLPYVILGNKLVLSIRCLTPEWLGKFVKMISDFKPEFIMGFPSVLSVLSSYIKHNGPAAFTKLKSVISYAETIYDWQRTLIGETFGVRVFSMYSMVERSAIGGECEHVERLHFHPLFGFAEFFDSAGGHREVVATGFTNQVMPLIRYRTGDLVTGGGASCPGCGRCHTVVDSVRGRIDDFLIGKDGEIIPRLMPWIKTFSNVRQFQFFQEEPGRAALKIVRGGGYSDDDTSQIRGWLDNMLGIMKDVVSIEIEFIDHIPAGLSGKTRMVAQKLDVRTFLKV